jgi:hypothetical protein
VLNDVERLATAASIAAIQLPNGTIPWTKGSDWDPWDHVECALALDCAGMHDAALAAYRHLSRTQRHDGAWACPIVGGRKGDDVLDSNGATYAAVGVWHHYLCTHDAGALHELWPLVERGIEFALDLQFPDGAIGWARNLDGHAGDHALLASSSSIALSLRCAIQIVHSLGDEKPDWELSLASLTAAIARGDSGFADRSRYSMDWYYPVLSGVLDNETAQARIAASWESFVVEGLGARCVVDRPWITSAETAELAIALHMCGLTDRATELFEWVQYLRADDGSYWTGTTFPDGRHFPNERTTWSGAANMLANDVLEGRGPIAEIFTGAALTPFEIASDALADTT